MTVREAIALCKGRVYIGIKSGFVAIEDAEKVLKMLEKESRNFYLLFIQRAANYEQDIKEMPGKAESWKEKAEKLKNQYENADVLVANGVFSEGKKKEIELSLRFAIASQKRSVSVYEEAKKRLPKLKKYLENWVEIPDRSVLEMREIHDKKANGTDGTVIICSGIEIGRFWFWEDVLAEVEKNDR